MEFNLVIGGRKNTGKFQGVVKVLMEFHGKKGKKQWKIPGGSESFDGIPGEKGSENGYPQQGGMDWNLWKSSIYGDNN